MSNENVDFLLIGIGTMNEHMHDDVELVAVSLEAYEKPQIQVLKLDQVIRGVSGSPTDAFSSGNQDLS